MNLEANSLETLMDELNACGDKYCRNIVTTKQMKEEELKFLKKVMKTCRAKTMPKTQEEDQIQKEKYNRCFTKLKNASKYYKKLTQRKQCEDKYCRAQQSQIQKRLKKRSRKTILQQQ